MEPACSHCSRPGALGQWASTQAPWLSGSLTQAGRKDQSREAGKPALWSGMLCKAVNPMAKPVTRVPQVQETARKDYASSPPSQ